MKNLLEEEINKFLWSDLSSNIEGYEFGMIPLNASFKCSQYAKSYKKGRYTDLSDEITVFYSAKVYLYQRFGTQWC